jgi:hypothetical protein
MPNVRGYTEFSSIVRADKDLTIFIRMMKIAFVLGRVKITKRKLNFFLSLDFP